MNNSHGEHFFGKIFSRSLGRAILFVGLTASTSQCFAAWVFVRLPLPPDAASVHVQGVQGYRRVGYVIMPNGRARAGYWNGSSNTWTYLTPESSRNQSAMDGGMPEQVGSIDINDVSYHASLWKGSASTLLDLHPGPIANYSAAFATADGQQVGGCQMYGGTNHASLWLGKSTTWVDLHPAWAYASGAGGVGDGIQVGHTKSQDNRLRACLWKGSSASAVDLHPAGKFNSYATGTDSGEQAGHVQMSENGPWHASIWTGSASSWRDLNPTGYQGSNVTRTFAGQQVGYAFPNGSGKPRAGIWHGTPDSFVDLHFCVPPEYDASDATGVWSDHLHTYVVGNLTNTNTGRAIPGMWIGPPPRNPNILSATMVSWNRFRVVVQGAWQGLPSGSYRLQAKINGTQIDKEFPSINSSTPETLDLRLDLSNVPKFETPQRFVVKVTQRAPNGALGTSSVREVFIPLPSIVVQGLFTDLSNPPLDPLVAQLKASGYSTGDYPTICLLKTSTYGYYPSWETLEKNALALQRAVFDFTNGTLTYAKKVDLVCHSKGGLVARTYLKDCDPYGISVRRLIMACTPQTGSLLSTLAVGFPVAVSRELAPVDPWYRRTPFEAFFVHASWQNSTLTQLNNATMPANIQYYLFYGYGSATFANETELPVPVFKSMDGDSIVNINSQRGYKTISNYNGSLTTGSLVPAFANIPPDKLIFKGLPHRHSDYLSGARNEVLWALMR